jgi:5-methyltetrahydrofolate--homocysteine methyltransferase
VKPLGDRLHRREPLVADGAMGTMLIARGLPAGEPPERWTLERPAVVEAVARAYAEAGADLLTTNTFGGSPLRLEAHGLAARVEEINSTAVELARSAAGGHAYVLACIGPSGRMLTPLGDIPPDRLLDNFRRQAAALAAAGADAICIETMTDVAEARLALEAVRAEAPGVPVFATMTFNLTPRGAFTVMGVSVARACAQLADHGADVVGANCGAGPEAMLVVAREFARATTLPLIFQPNAGLPRQQDGRLVYPQSPATFAMHTAALMEAALIVGGCCGTTPAHIAALRDALHR